jgi:hypothetical protein
MTSLTLALMNLCLAGIISLYLRESIFLPAYIRAVGWIAVATNVAFGIFNLSLI